jgi:hypothetical protein
MVIGHGRRMKARIGLRRTTLVDGIFPVSGKAVAATLRTTIAGTETGNETNIAVLRAITTTIGTITTTAIADVKAESSCSGGRIPSGMAP